MKVFISWSGDFSHECAKIIFDLVDTVIQDVQPWLSSKDIDKGSTWFNSINEELRETNVGIVCLTPDNKDNRWILFEAGALSKGLQVNRVCTFLINLRPSDLNDPLAQFNHTLFEKESVRELLKTINKELENPVKESTIDKTFDLYWVEIESRMTSLIESQTSDNTASAEPVTRSDQMLEEILLSTRSIGKRVGSIQKSIAVDIVGHPYIEPDPRFIDENVKNENNVHLATLAVLELERSIKALVDKGASREDIFDAYVDRIPLNILSDLAVPLIRQRDRKNISDPLATKPS